MTRDHPMCWRFAVTRDDERKHGRCSYYGDTLPDEGLNWIGPKRRDGGAIYCDRHWAQIQVERQGRNRDLA